MTKDLMPKDNKVEMMNNSDDENDNDEYTDANLPEIVSIPAIINMEEHSMFNRSRY